MPLKKQHSPIDAEASAALVETIGAPEFGSALLDLAHNAAEVEELFAYLVLDGQEPEVLVTESRLIGASQRVKEYVDRFYKHDPAVHETRAVPPGQSFVQRIAPNHIIPSDYRRRCFSEPSFSEKFSFGWRGQGYLIVLSFYRTKSHASSALSKLASLASLTLAILVRHYSPISDFVAIDVIERRLRRSFPQLSPREVEICARTLLGWTAEQTGTAMSITKGTVITYRQRAYLKLGVCNAGELLPAILR